MKKLLFALVASAIVALSFIAGAGANNAASFAVGSAKADFILGSQHVAFSAHNGSLFSLPSADCSATGHLNYTIADTGFSMSVDVTILTIRPFPTGGGLAFIAGRITNVTTPNVFNFYEGEYAWFDAQDSNMQPDGTGDTFKFEAVSPTPPPCLAGRPGTPITSGNIVVKAGSLVP